MCSCPWKLKTQGYSCILQKSPRHTSGSDKRVELEQIHPGGISRASLSVRIMRYEVGKGLRAVYVAEKNKASLFQFEEKKA